MLSALATQRCQAAVHPAVAMVAAVLRVAVAVVATAVAAVVIMTGVAVLRQAQSTSQVCTRPIADLCLVGCKMLLEPVYWL